MGQWLEVTLRPFRRTDRPRLEVWLIRRDIKGWVEHEDGSVCFYLSPQEVRQGRPEALQQELPKSLRWSAAFIDEEDWAEGWKQYFKPVVLTERLAVCPSWEIWEPPAGVRVIHMDPGMAFGTGGHATTRMCLEMIDRYLPPQGHLLDVGTGSGILAVGALHLGARDAVCTDSDPLCVDVAAENLRRNGYEGRFTCSQGYLLDPVAGRRFHLIVANLVTPALIELAPLLPAHLQPGGMFVGGGTTVARLPEISKATAEAGLLVLEARTEGEWATVAARWLG